MNKPLLSIASITYNHEKFIAQAIESWLMQKTNFDIEIVIGEDCSTDNTLQIIKEYQKRYPHLIKIITSDSNVGMQANFFRTLKACQGKYIALCEGDDYWTNPYKLQKQVDFLEENEDYSVVGHGIQRVNVCGNHIDYFMKAGDFRQEDLFKDYPIATLSILFRSKYIKSIPDWFFKIKNGDLGLLIILLHKSKGYIIPEILGVQTIHSGGVWSQIPTFDRLNIIYHTQITLKNECNILNDKSKILNSQIIKEVNENPLFYKKINIIELLKGQFSIKVFMKFLYLKLKNKI